MLYRISLRDVNTNFVTNFPLGKREIEKMRGKELSAKDTAKIFPDMNVADMNVPECSLYELTRDRRFRRKVLDYLLKLRVAERKGAVMPYMEAIVLHDNEWQSMNKIRYKIS